MLFSRDAVAERIATVNDRLAVLQVVNSVNLILGILLLFFCLFISNTWGAGLAFQAASTAMINLALSGYVFQWLKQPDATIMDFVGGMYIVSLMMLLQTSAVWSGVSTGFFSYKGGGNQFPCVVVGTSSFADRGVSVLAAFLFVGQSLFGSLLTLWRSDFFSPRNRSEYVPVVGAAATSSKENSEVLL